jgi:hypothetical protein
MLLSSKSVSLFYGNFGGISGALSFRFQVSGFRSVSLYVCKYLKKL